MISLNEAIELYGIDLLRKLIPLTFEKYNL